MDSKQIAEAMRLKLPVRYNGITFEKNLKDLIEAGKVVVMK